MSHRVLCIDDNEKFLFGLKTILKPHYKTFVANSLERAENIVKNDSIDLILLDVNMEDQNGLSLLERFKSLDPNLVIIMLSGYKDAQTIVEAMKLGAVDYLVKPCPSEELLAVLHKNLKNRDTAERSDALIEHYNEQKKFKTKLIGNSRVIQGIRHQIQKLKGHTASVLIQGESGTGKEVIARLIHEQEDDAKRPFIAVNCAAIPENLLESELFGHEKGAFTGADKRKIGKFELASGGDLLLDEINSLKPEMQAKLLRILQEKEFYRLGGTSPIQVNVRVIAASNADLAQKVASGEFRQDLFFRLRVICFNLPPLRERPNDLRALIDFFLKQLVQGRKSLSPAANEVLLNYPWPGNVRELKNVLESILILSPNDEIQVSDLPDWIRQQSNAVDLVTPVDKSLAANEDQVPNAAETLPTLTFDGIQHTLKDYISHVEKDYIKRAIDHTGNVTKAARKLGISRSTLYNLLNKEVKPQEAL